MTDEDNPFHYGSPATGEFFVDRERELADVVGRMSTGQNVVLLSPRRYGKTSLLRECLGRAQERGVRTGYASLLRCSSRRDVAEALLQAVVNGPLSWMARQHERLGELLSRVRLHPRFELESTGGFRFDLGASMGEQDWRRTIQDVIRLLRHASEGDRPVAFVMDEFQRVHEIDAGLPGLFKELTDELERVSLTFSGSKLHIMRQLSTGHGAPLLDIGERIALQVVPKAAMVAFLTERSRERGRPMERGAAELAFELVDGIPNDVQRVAYEAYLLARESIDEGVVQAALERIVEHRSADYEEMFSELSPSQQRVARELARKPTEAVYARAFLDAVEVANHNAVRTALAVLEHRELVARRSKTWTVTDAFFRAWLSSATQ